MFFREKTNLYAKGSYCLVRVYSLKIQNDSYDDLSFQISIMFYYSYYQQKLNIETWRHDTINVTLWFLQHISLFKTYSYILFPMPKDYKTKLKTACVIYLSAISTWWSKE